MTGGLPGADVEVRFVQARWTPGSWAALDALDEHFDGCPGDLAPAGIDAGQGGEGETAGVDVVEADDRDVLGHSDTGFAKSAQSTDREGVVEGEERIELQPRGKELTGGVGAVLRVTRGDTALAQ